MITKREELKYDIQEDKKYYAHKLQNTETLKGKMWNYYFMKTDLLAVFLIKLRKTEFYDYMRQNAKSYYTMMHISLKKISYKLGFSIPINSIGAGLNLPHYGTIVINPFSKIGTDCEIHTGVNIGIQYGKCPTIGNNCFIGPGVKIFGGITIGDNVVIAGVPAKIVKYKES
jgi:serine O-acetyltransferase